MTKRDKTREYLEEALAEAKRQLSSRSFAVLQAIARAKAGGKISGKRRKERKEQINKGFANGSPEGGMHAHGLNRAASKTNGDGAHMHVFSMPGGGFLVTSEDGTHAHGLDGDWTQDDGAHSHAVGMPDGSTLETKLGGNHEHPLMTETTGFAGVHGHALTLEDGTEIESLTVSQFLDITGEIPPSIWLPPASDITSALGDLAECRRHLVDLEEAMEMALAPKGTLIASHHDEMELVKDGEAYAITMAEEPFIDFTGPDDAKLVFVSSSPNPTEKARKKAFCGQDGLVFDDKYLGALEMTRDDVALGFCIPCDMPEDFGSFEETWKEWLTKKLDVYENATVIAIGKLAKNVLGDRADFVLPQPAAIRRHGDRGELARKLKQITKNLDELSAKSRISDVAVQSPTNGDTASHIAESNGDDSANAFVRVSKADEDKRIVYGVCLDPYERDAHGDWFPPSVVEQTAHEFMKESQLIGLQHIERANGKIVESFIETYPSAADYKSAMTGLPHRATKRRFGSDVIKSGSWVLGVELGQEEWAAYQAGELTGFSIGALTVKTDVPVEAMPQVDFVDLVERDTAGAM